MRLPRTPAAALLLAALAAAGCRRAPAPDARSAAGFGIDAAPGVRAPAVELTAQDGSHVSLASLKGQVVLVNFWATWCPPCREEMPSMMALGKDLEARHPGKFKMLAVSVDDGWDPVRAFIAAAPYGGRAEGLTVALDRPDQATTVAYYCAARSGCPGEYKFPESYIVDPRGRLVSYVVGPRDWSDPRARAYLESLIE
jgi:cytochrome oxidase Cu insertion factor (SCO1/SenC/PrrC family)